MTDNDPPLSKFWFHFGLRGSLASCASIGIQNNNPEAPPEATVNEVSTRSEAPEAVGLGQIVPTSRFCDKTDENVHAWLDYYNLTASADGRSNDRKYENFPFLLLLSFGSNIHS